MANLPNIKLEVKHSVPVLLRIWLTSLILVLYLLFSQIPFISFEYELVALIIPLFTAGYFFGNIGVLITFFSAIAFQFIFFYVSEKPFDIFSHITLLLAVFTSGLAGGFYFELKLDHLAKQKRSEQEHKRLSDTLYVKERELERSMILLDQEIDVRKQIERHLRLKDMVFESTTEGIVVTDSKGIIHLINPAFTTITGYDEEEAVGKSPGFLKSGQHPTDFYKSMWSILRSGGTWQGEVWNRRKTGEIYPQFLTVSGVKDEHSDLRYYVGVFHDLEEIKEKEAIIEHNAYYDKLTDLPNRLLFNDRMNLAVSQADRKARSIGIMIIDLDRFKRVNDSLGLSAGDEIITEASKRIAAQIRAGDTLARTGGDEFSLLLPDISRPEDVAEIASRILEDFRSVFRVESSKIFVSCSIGISIFPDDGNDLKSLLRSADLALLRAKEHRNSYQFFTEDLNTRLLRRISLENTLRTALLKDWMKLYFQPVVDLRNGNIVSTEALARLTDPEKGAISPGQFIPLAEETGIIYQLGEWVFKTACNQYVQWQQNESTSVKMAINLSARQFLRSDLHEIIKSILDESAANPENIIIEITENSIIQDIDASVNILHDLKEMGVSISIDDFGTGYSSLSYLKRFPIDTLKIDQSFIKDLSVDPQDRTIVQATISMAHSMGIKVVAEGIETPGQLEFLKSNNCDFGQGYLFSKPIGADELSSLLQLPSPFI